MGIKHAFIALVAWAAAASAQLESPTFPYCPCVRNVKNPPYNWKLSSKKGNRYCYKVTASAADEMHSGRSLLQFNNVQIGNGQTNVQTCKPGQPCNNVQIKKPSSGKKSPVKKTVKKSVKKTVTKKPASKTPTPNSLLNQANALFNEVNKIVNGRRSLLQLTNVQTGNGQTNVQTCEPGKPCINVQGPDSPSPAPSSSGNGNGIGNNLVITRDANGNVVFTPKTPAPTPSTPAPTPSSSGNGNGIGNNMVITRDPSGKIVIKPNAPETPAPTPSTPAPTPSTPAPTPSYSPKKTPSPVKGSGNTYPAKCSKYDLKKIELDTPKRCKGAFSDITFNGKKVSPSYQGFDNGGLVTKFTRGGSNVLATYDEIASEPAVVCFTVKEGCYSESTPAAFFSKDNDCCPGPWDYPSPPPRPKAPSAPRKPSPPEPFQPAPESLFPYCPCTRDLAGPYSFSAAKKTGNTICWDLTAKATRSGWCSDYDLRKIEFDVDLGCKGSVASATFGGDSLSPSWQPFPDQGGLVFKITRGSKDKPLGTYKDLAGKTTTVCITLQGACNTLEKWGRGDVLAHTFFSPDNKCCPLNY